MQLLIRRCGTLIDVSPDGRSALPVTIAQLLVPHLTYEYKRLLRGADAYDPSTGFREGVEVTTKALYKLDEGRLTTGYGFLPKIARILSAAGHDPRYVDVTPPRPRQRCYVPDWENVARHGVEFRPRQEECIRAIGNNLGGIINAPTGMGKSFLITVLSLLFREAKIAIVVKPVGVAERLVRDMTRWLPAVGQVGGGRSRAERVTVYTADSMHRCDGDVDFLFCDEVHQLMSPKHSESLGEIFRYTRNYGFTATPEGRLDGADAKLEMFFGPQIFYMSYAEAVQLGLVAPIFVRWLPIRMNHNPAHGKSGVPRMRWGVWRNQDRNMQIATDARSYSADTQVLVLTATIDHAIHLWNCMPEFELCYAQIDPEDFDRYKRNNMLPQSAIIMTPERRASMRAAFEQNQLKKVIATDVWSTGVDFQQLQVMYRADARDSEVLDTQAPGRVSRVYHGKSCGEVVDCIDYFDKTLRRKSENRKRHYRSRGWDDDWPERRRQIGLA